MKTDLYIPVSLSPPTFWIAFSSTIVSLKLLIASSDGLLNKLDTLNLTPSSDVSVLVLLSASVFTSPPSKNSCTGFLSNVSFFLTGFNLLTTSSSISVSSALLNLLSSCTAFLVSSICVSVAIDLTLSRPLSTLSLLSVTAFSATCVGFSSSIICSKGFTVSSSCITSAMFAFLPLNGIFVESLKLSKLKLL